MRKMNLLIYTVKLNTIIIILVSKHYSVIPYYG